MKIFAFADEVSSNVDEQITALKENGLDGLEIRNVDGVNVADITDSKAYEVKAKMDKIGLSIWSIGSPIGKIDVVDGDFAAHIEKFKRTLEIAEILGAKNIRLFSFFIPKNKNPDDYKSVVLERLSAFCEISKGKDITLCHENEKGIYGDTPERCLEIFKALPEIKAIFDPANYIQCGVNTLKAWEMIKPYVKYLHIKDALSDGNIVPAGKGEGNLKYILDDYKKIGGDEVTLEPHLMEFEGLKGLEQEGDKSLVGELVMYSSNEEAFKAGADALKILLHGEELWK